MDRSPGGVEELSPDEFRECLDRGESLVVLDVREDDERAYATIRLPSTAVDLHIPLGQVSSRSDEIAEAADGRTLVVYCHHGMRSMAAATWLSRKGMVDVRNLEGGIDSWSIRVDRTVARY